MMMLPDESGFDDVGVVELLACLDLYESRELAHSLNDGVVNGFRELNPCTASENRWSDAVYRSNVLSSHAKSFSFLVDGQKKEGARR